MHIRGKCPLLKPSRSLSTSELRSDGNTPTSLTSPFPGPASTIPAHRRAYTVLPGLWHWTGEESTNLGVMQDSIFPPGLSDFSLTLKLSLLLFVSGKAYFLMIPQKLHGWQASLLLGSAWSMLHIPRATHSQLLFPCLASHLLSQKKVTALTSSLQYHSPSKTHKSSTLLFTHRLPCSLSPILFCTYSCVYIFVLTTNYKHHTEQDLQPPLSPLRSPCTAHQASEGIRAKMLLLWNRAVRLLPPSLLKFPKPALKSSATAFSLDSFSDSYDTI